MLRAALTTALVAVALILMVPLPSLYFESGGGTRCLTCHEMQSNFDQWHSSSHRGVGCAKCHGDALTTDASFHLNNVKRAYTHLLGELPERVGFANKDVQAMTERCGACHAQEYAAWRTGPHSATYERIFANKTHNGRNMLMDDCLRCHGMHFEGSINDLVSPIDRKGPWRIVPAGVAGMPSIPCLACHETHRKGAPLQKTGVEGRVAGPVQELARPSLALFDRRTGSYVPVSEMPLPAMRAGARPVRMSKDQRQALCYQCHAPVATFEVGSGDDRTATGVHEGISCLACHQQHGQKTRASCASCHPKMSNCGLDVEQMDTSFKSSNSKHNIHWVKCADCHTKGVPRKKEFRP